MELRAARRLGWMACGLAVLLFGGQAGALELRAPATIGTDQNIAVEVDGEVEERSFVTVVEPAAADGKYVDYSYVRSGRAELRAPGDVGSYELRLLGPKAPYPTLARRSIRVEPVEATLSVAAVAEPGALLKIDWHGPGGSGEYVTIVEAGAAEGSYDSYVYVPAGESGQVSLTAPNAPGSYEVRYVAGGRYRTLAFGKLDVGAPEATMVVASRATAGASIKISWRGPDNPRHYFTVVAPEAPASAHTSSAYAKGSPVSLRLPDEPGSYEVRFVSADGKVVFARSPIDVDPATASVQAPLELIAGQEFDVDWQGPNNQGDYVAITRPGRPDQYLGYSYTQRGNPLRLPAPDEVGAYEVHYLTGGKDRSLAVLQVQVRPGAATGTLRVRAASDQPDSADSNASARSVALILDASGSMLQRLQGTRRIDLARTALEQLLETGISDADAVSLRVFGHRKPDACDTQLLLPRAVGQRERVQRVLREIEARNLAKTPIAASLAGVRQDLAGHKGPAVIVLLTDGEETCDGDPIAEIRRLRADGFNVIVNVVGFAVDEHAVVRDFRAWAQAGGGVYLAAPDAAALADSLRAAVAPAFSVWKDGKAVATGAAGGPAIKLAPGRYAVRIGAAMVEVDVVAGQETSASP